MLAVGNSHVHREYSFWFLSKFDLTNESKVLLIIHEMSTYLHHLQDDFLITI